MERCSTAIDSIHKDPVHWDSQNRKSPVLAYNAVMHDTPATRPPITDSPWYWTYLFCTAGLIALFLAGPRFSARQTQIERKYEARQRASQYVAGRTSAEPFPPASRRGTRITLQPLYLILGGVLSVAWVSLWWWHYRPTRPLPKPVQSEEVKQ